MSEVLNVEDTTPIIKSIHRNTALVQKHLKAGAEVNHVVLNFGSYNNSGFEISFRPPGTDVIIDKRVLLSVPVRVQGNALNGTAPRTWPVASVMSVLNVTINGTTVTSSPRDLVHVYERLGNNAEFRAKFWSLTPSYPDFASSYAKLPPYIGRQCVDAALGATVVAGTFVNLPNPISPFCEESFHKGDYELPRAAFPFTGTAATNRAYQFTEPLLSPVFSDNEEEGLVNISDLKISCIFDSVLKKMWSSNGAAAGLAVTLAADGAGNPKAPQLLVTYIRPVDSKAVPMEFIMPIVDNKFFMQPSVLDTAINVPTKEYFNNIQLNTVPRKLIIFCRQKESSLTEEYANGFANISNINLTIGTRSGLLSGCTEMDLYQMSAKNGLNLNWTQWNKRIGSILVVDWAEDLGGESPGSKGNLSLSFEITVTNKFYTDLVGDTSGTVSPLKYELCMFAVTDGKINITRDSAMLSQGLSQQDRADAENTELSGQGFIGGEFGEMLGQGRIGAGKMGGNLYGGSWKGFWRGLKKGVSGAANMGMAVLAPHAYAAKEAAKALAVQQVNKGARQLLGNYQ